MSKFAFSSNLDAMLRSWSPQLRAFYRKFLSESSFKANNETISGAWEFNQSVRVGDTIYGNNIIYQDTQDGLDSQLLDICGGGAASKDRGARVIVFGNEHASNAGNAYLDAGNVAGAKVRLRHNDTTIFSISSTLAETEKPLSIANAAGAPASSASRGGLYSASGRPAWVDSANRTQGVRTAFTPAHPSPNAGSLTTGNRSGSYEIWGDFLFFEIAYDSYTQNAAPATTYTLALPINAVNTTRRIFSAIDRNASDLMIANTEGSDTTMTLRKRTGGTWAIGGGFNVVISGFYPIT